MAALIKCKRTWTLVFVGCLCYYGFIYFALHEATFDSAEYPTEQIILEDLMNCDCPERKLPAFIDPILMSTCDSYATARGPHQMVINFAFHGHVSNVYFKGIDKNAALITRFYPNWVMRVYHNLDLDDVTNRKAVCSLWCKHQHLDFCHVKHLPPPLFDQSSANPRVWRFYALGDPLVNRLVSRDLDSLITEREMAAVGEWLVSGKTWHFMRDHPLHAYPIMAGMWGGLNHNLTLTTELRDRLIAASQVQDNIGTDQATLRSILMPIAEENGDYINHDSFSCHEESPKKAWPWPVKRLTKTDFVGSPVLRYDAPIFGECPMQCRPPNHQDWTLC